MNRHLIALSAGVLGGAIPNTKSNINPLLMGAILAVLLVKILEGDWDAGYQWTLSDIPFGISTIVEGVFGALLVQRRR
jgi:hypothetical protein